MGVYTCERIFLLFQPSNSEPSMNIDLPSARSVMAFVMFLVFAVVSTELSIGVNIVLLIAYFITFSFLALNSFSGTILNDEDYEEESGVNEMQEKYRGKEVILHSQDGSIIRGRMEDPNSPCMVKGNILLSDAVEMRRDSDEDTGDLAAIIGKGEIIEKVYLDPLFICRIDIVDMDKV